jgi:hypothetical protein
MCLLLKSEGGYSTNKLTVSHIFLAGHRGCCNTARTAAFGSVRATENSPGGHQIKARRRSATIVCKMSIAEGVNRCSVLDLLSHYTICSNLRRRRL